MTVTDTTTPTPEQADGPTASGTEETTQNAGETSRIRCSCGFEVVGADEFFNGRALEEHPCPNRPEEYTPWWGFIFSFWGWAITATIGYTIIAVILGKPWNPYNP